MTYRKPISKTVLLTVLGCLIVTCGGCGKSGKAAAEAAKEAIKGQLNDPYTAKFTDLKIYKFPDGKAKETFREVSNHDYEFYVVADVHAKNGYGNLVKGSFSGPLNSDGHHMLFELEIEKDINRYVTFCEAKLQAAKAIDAGNWKLVWESQEKPE